MINHAGLFIPESAAPNIERPLKLVEGADGPMMTAEMFRKVVENENAWDIYAFLQKAPEEQMEATLRGVYQAAKKFAAEKNIVLEQKLKVEVDPNGPPSAGDFLRAEAAKEYYALRNSKRMAMCVREVMQMLLKFCEEKAIEPEQFEYDRVFYNKATDTVGVSLKTVSDGKCNYVERFVIPCKVKGEV